jgi:hypothetical protein
MLPTVALYGLALPMHPYLDGQTQIKITNAIRAV